ncbi:asparagine synthase (glutamine-hydrolysing) [Butyrivibrio sp. INlla18]|uniref:asparagine synthase B n=1 Tax=Butyrivibrio sp. INlla18 TaxID=1520806 RepID=UPI00088B6972|nr:asparagine synthase B [Butyrivibrio sp. INlla18]SDA57513.1 asparagine synthase (glutamine-hydrolysing) [Butyrivibrio sp. INlla18]
MCAILTYARESVREEFFEEMLSRTVSRGPDMSRIQKVEGGWMGFNRLSIMGLNESGMQPFNYGKNTVICNGELYGFKDLRNYLVSLGYSFKSDSDCEILLPLYEKLGTKMFSLLDAEFACVIYDGEKKKFVAARDPIGIRPLYYGYDSEGYVVFASEPKNLVEVTDKIMPFPPGHYYEDGEFVCYKDMTEVKEVSVDDLETITDKIHDKLLNGIKKRLDADAPVGFLLSGGLDSSLVCGVAASLSDKPLETFAIGMDIDAIDLKYAREVAEYIHSNHHEVIITKDDVINAIEPVIHALGTYDITTIRASIGMYLLCKWIHENTDIKVVLTGEISDELFGYKYTDFAPSAQAFQEEAEKRIREIHMYDVLRADRCISVNSLEARVPFGDLDFVNYVMSIDPEKKLNTYGIGKFLLRKAFEKDQFIPHSILMREKAAFSDAVGHSLRDDLMDYADAKYTYAEYETLRKKYTHAKPFTKESLLYRETFEKYYPGQSDMVIDFWMPNKSWKGCNVNDPSARVLSNYGASGE